MNLALMFIPFGPCWRAAPRGTVTTPNNPSARGMAHGVGRTPIGTPHHECLKAMLRSGLRPSVGPISTLADHGRWQMDRNKQATSLIGDGMWICSEGEVRTRYTSDRVNRSGRQDHHGAAESTTTGGRRSHRRCKLRPLRRPFRSWNMGARCAGLFARQGTARVHVYPERSSLGGGNGVEHDVFMEAQLDTGFRLS